MAEEDELRSDAMSFQLGRASFEADEAYGNDLNSFNPDELERRSLQRKVFGLMTEHL